MTLPTEHVQDYPRPPLLEPAPYRITAEAAGHRVIDTEGAWRVCETHHPPTYYFPVGSIIAELVPARGSSWCEWKGQASYWSLKIGEVVLPRIGWSYPRPSPGFEPIGDYLSFYPEHFESAEVAGLKVRAQPGDFYGGWVTDNLTGIVKGGPGTLGW
ncbi:MAG: DUF427 domain-containing protein [Pseudomonadota bacterium]